MSPPERSQVETSLDPRAAGGPESPTQVAVLEKRPERCGERRFVACRNEEPGLAIDDELSQAADVGRYDWERGRHRLQDRDRQALRPAREHEHVRLGEERWNVIPLARQYHALLEPEPADLRLHSTS